ncbi:hypothetical protein THOM_2877, partial [Trachipleistophora hominis]
VENCQGKEIRMNVLFTDCRMEDRCDDRGKLEYLRIIF